MREKKQTVWNKESLTAHLPLISLAVFIVIALAMILVGYFGLQIPLVPVGTFVILEAVLCACLNRMPVWVHGVVVILQIAMGFYLGKGIFMICMAVVYVAAVALLYLWTREL